MIPIETLDKLLFTVLGGILLWLGRVLAGFISRSTESRREQVDKLAESERRVHLLTESLYDHRNIMLKSGQWSRETLPPFTKE